MAATQRFVSDNFAGHCLARYVLDGTFIDVTFADADLSDAILSGTFMDVDFSYALLVGARLAGQFVDVRFAGADLAFCDLRGSNLRLAQLQQAFRLQGAVMPDGTIYDGSLNLPGD
jgi:uncharacterized protein YjbI with pentapeptide repeats